MQTVHRFKRGSVSLCSLLPACLALLALGWAGTGKAADSLLAQATPLSSRIATLLQREGFELPVTAEADEDATTPAVTEAFAPASKGARTPPIPGSQRMAYPTQQHAAGLIVRFRNPETQAAAEAEAAMAALRTLGTPTQYQRAMSGGLHVLRFNTPLDAEQAEAAAEAVRELDEVEWAVPDLLVRPQAVSDDPYFSQQWSLHRPVSGAIGIDAESAWDISIGSSKVVVAIVDNGIRPHPEFRGRLLPGYDFVSDARRANDDNGRDADPSDPGDWVRAGECGQGEPAADSSWHGTLVAGVLGAGGDNGFGIAGISWRSSLLPVRVLGKCGGLASDVLDGMRWAIGLPVPGVPTNPNPARILNLSLSVEYPFGCYPPYRELIAEATRRGALVVVAAGNYSAPASNYSPANCAQALTVIATGPDGERAGYSNYGSNGLSAPGGDFDRFGTAGGVLSTADSGARGPRGTSYGYAQGSSMATPHVAGIAALALSVAPRLSAEELRQILLHGSAPFPADSDCARSRQCGVGVANARRSLAAASALSNYTLVREFYNTDLRHYFRTGSEVEAAQIHRGSAGAGWIEVDDLFYAWTRATDRTSPVCRFYGTPGIGPNSHFYTATPAECEAVKRDPGWTYEGIAFHVIPHANGLCPGDTVAVHRAYNQRWQFNDSNHRYSTELRKLESMRAQGWTVEGVAWCAAA